MSAALSDSTTQHCQRCGEPVQVWADNSGGVTVNFACDNPRCPAGKAPWDTPRPSRPNEGR